MDAMRPNLMYKVDETGFKLTYSDGNQKLLTVNGSKRFTVLLTEEEEKL
jgi:hypothetical protein